MKVPYLYAILIIFFLSSQALDAYESKSNGVKFIAGAAAFLDEETPLDHFVIGAAGVIGLTPRLRIEPQFLYMNGPDSDRDITITGNLLYDMWFTQKSALYVVVGGGLLRHTQDFAVVGPFSSYDGTFSGGVGMRFDVSEKFYVAPEFRVGWDPLYQIAGMAGFKF